MKRILLAVLGAASLSACARRRGARSRARGSGGGRQAGSRGCRDARYAQAT
ncbi:hypothetical protein [Lysobacter enzymogenes]|uniref:hypothetical protein n=1 Tax=Lysobacter enzymogenes TaxID=69 RepID=UPI001441E785|nr:hypothetical protein [Lysobacter enzymogenes]